LKSGNVRKSEKKMLGGLTSSRVVIDFRSDNSRKGGDSMLHRTRRNEMTQRIMGQGNETGGHFRERKRIVIMNWKEGDGL